MSEPGTVKDQATRERAIEAEKKRQEAEEDAPGWVAFGLLLLVIVAPIAWFGFHQASMARVAVGVGAICIVVGIVKGRGSRDVDAAAEQTKSAPDPARIEGAEADGGRGPAQVD